MKAPISKQLTDHLIIPFVAVACVGLYDLYSVGQKRLEQNIVIILTAGIPTILVGWFLLDKRFEFKENKKVCKAERLFQIPFSSFSCLYIFIISSLLIFGGLGSVFSNHNYSEGLPMLTVGLTVFALTAIAHDHPRIWFSDSNNIEDDIERLKNTPKEDYPMYQDGIFSYSDNSFTIELDKKTQTVNWNDITLIRAYKVDQFTVDCIVIEIYLKETFITINDQTAGHMKFMDIAAEKLNDFKKNWFAVVAFPAFATNLTTIYERQSEQIIS